MSQDRPGSVIAATWLLGALLAVYGAAALLTWLFDDDLVRAWQSTHGDSEGVEPPAFVAVSVVMYLVVALLMVILQAFLWSGHGWARTVQSVMVVLSAIGSVALLATDPPTVFWVSLLVALVVSLGLLVALWGRETSAHLRAASEA